MFIFDANKCVHRFLRIDDVILFSKSYGTSEKWSKNTIRHRFHNSIVIGC